MSRARDLAYAAAAMCLIAGCKDQPTGLRVTVHSKGVAYDELRFGLIDIDNDGGPVTLVDPNGAGRKSGLSAGPDPDVVILLDDSVAGHEIVCDVEARLEGAPTGSGITRINAQAHSIREVDVFLMASPTDDGGAPDDAAVDGNDEGGSGIGGGNGSGGAAGQNGGGGNNGQGGSIDGSVDAGRPDARTDGGAGGSNGSGGASGTGGKPGTGALGSSCTSAGQCMSLFCVDGVCCESACNTACTTCNFNNGQAVRCRQVMNRSVDPHHVCVDTGAGNCGTDGTCDNTGACTLKFGTACSTAGCATARSKFATGICSQGGACLGIGNTNCPPGMPACVAGVCQ
jgi:hypothetical protein